MASFLSNLFGGGAEREAAERNRAAVHDYFLRGSDALNRGLDRSADALRTGAVGANAYQRSNSDLYRNLRNAGTAILDRGRADSLAALAAGDAAYDPLAALGTKHGAGTDLYLDSLGVRGAGGNQRAAAAFQEGPGYAFARDQGLEALNRRRAAAGMLNSGNADIDAIRFGTGLADQAYGAWQDRLAGLISPELSATSGAATGRAGVQANIANAAAQDALARLGLEQGVTTGQAGANSARGASDVALGNALANLYSTDAGNRVSLAGNYAGGNVAANNLQAQGEAQGARNLFNAGMGLANLAAGAFGGGGMFGAGSALGNLFGAGRAGTGGMGLGSGAAAMTTGRFY